MFTNLRRRASFAIAAGLLIASLGTVHFVGIAHTDRTQDHSATIRTPDWTPTVAPGDYLYDWVMVHDQYAQPNGWILQIGWMVNTSGNPVVASYAWVGGVGGWDAYHEHPEIKLAPGSDHRYRVARRSQDWWDLQVDGVTLDTFNVPGTSGFGQAMVETNDDHPKVPDLRTADISDGAGPCVLDTDAAWSVPAWWPCSLFYARKS